MEGLRQERLNLCSWCVDEDMETNNCKHQEADSRLKEIREGSDFPVGKVTQEGFSGEVALEAPGGHWKAKVGMGEAFHVEDGGGKLKWEVVGQSMG